MEDKENGIAIKKRPIDKEYLKTSLQNFKEWVLDKTYTTHVHDNKNILDRLNVSENNSLLFDGKEINNSSSSAGKSAYQIAQENGFEGTEQEWLDSLKATATKSEKKIYVTSASILYTGNGSTDNPLTCELSFQDLPYSANNNWLLDIYIEPFTVSLINASYEENTVSNPTHIVVSLDPSTCTSINVGDTIKVIGKIYLSELG